MKVSQILLKHLHKNEQASNAKSSETKLFYLRKNYDNTEILDIRL